MGRHGMHCGREGRGWRAMMMMGGRRGWGGFGPDGPFGPNGAFGPSGPFGPDGPFGRGAGGGRGGHGRRGRMFDASELRLLLLKLIAEAPRHGYDLIRTIEEKSGGSYAPSPGVVYPTLSFLADEGLIEEQATEGARKRFAATEAGRAQLDENKDEVAAILARLDQVRPEPRAGDRQLQRALDNLRTAMRNRVAEADWDEAAVREITDILDEAVRRIERAQ